MIAYFDCFSGISGDMTLGAFIDLGVDIKWLKETISAIPLSGFDLTVSNVLKKGISAKNVCVHIKEDTSHRDYTQIKGLIENSPLSEKVKVLSLEIFEKIADAESIIHGCKKDKVHFHEVGGIDAIVDIVGTALCVDQLGISKMVSSKIPLGTGFVECHHGKLPLPAPATVAILKDAPVYGTEIDKELVTPTGAAIITTLADTFGTLPDMVVENTGYGAGNRDLPSIPNVLRVITGTPVDHKELSNDSVVMVETCIDDMNPEIFGFLMDRLFEDGALDVNWVPIFMKKNRPGTMIKILCATNNREVIVRRLLSETTSIGVRYYDVQRTILEREQIEIQTTYGKITAKKIIDPNVGPRIVPEYEACRKIALEKNIPIKIVYDNVILAIANLQ